MKFNLSIIISICFIVGVVAQNKQFKLSGNITDENKTPIEFATVYVEDTTSDTELKETTTDANGGFSFNLDEGEYTIVLEAFGFQDREQKINLTADKNLGSVVMSTEQIELNAANIIGERPLYRVELDKKVYDLERDQTARGQSLSDALNNVPSVQVDGEGTVSVRGNENVRILINGKPSALTGISDSADALRNLPADAVKRVEVITNPSSRYDAEGAAGIINIVMKKGVKTGFNGSVSAFTGYRINTGVNASLNYKTEKFNFFATPTIRYSEPKGNSRFINRLFTNGVIDTVEIQNGDRFRNRFNLSLNLGTEYNLTKKTTLSLSGFYRFSDGENERNLVYEDFANNVLYSESTRDEIEDETDDNYETTFGLVHEFNEDGHELSLQASAAYSEEDELADIVENISFGVGEDVQDQTTNNEAQNRYLLQLDYVLPYGNGAQFEAGYKSEFVQNRNDVLVESLVNGVPQIIDLFTGFTKNQQDVHAFYTQYGNKFGKFSFLTGLRLEVTDVLIDTQSVLESNVINKDYTDLFPSVFLNYTFDEEEKNQLQISYSRRIRRPFSRFLNPFFSFADDRNTFRGNPDLNPVYTDSYEVGFITEIGKVSINPTIYIQNSEDVINIFRRQQQLSFGNETRSLFVANPVNVGAEDRYGLELVVSAKPFAFWRFFTNLNLFIFNQEGIYIDPENGNSFDFSGDGVSWFSRINNTFNLPGKVDFQMNVNYRGPQNNAQADRKGIFNMDIAVSKDLLKENATLSLNVNDVFNSRKRRITNFGDDFESDIQFQWRETQLTLNFTYRFNQKKEKRRDRNQGNFDGSDGGY